MTAVKQDLLRLTRHLISIIAGVCLLTSGSAMAQSTAADAEAARIQAIAEEAYLYGMPLVQEYAVMRSFAIDQASPQFKAPFNAIKSIGATLTPADKAIPYPNNDTLYSISWLDLRAEPVVLSLPAIDKGRYYSVILSDAASMNYGLISSRLNGYEAASYLVVGPDWQGDTPSGISSVIRSPSPFSMTLIRTQVIDADDLPKVHALQASYKVQTLSAFLGKPAPAAAPEIAFPEIDRELAQKNFFFYLDFLMRMTPVQPGEEALRTRLESIGLGKDFAAFQALAKTRMPALMAGVQSAQKKLEERIAGAGPKVNGWNWNLDLDIKYSTYRGDILKRAALTKVGPHGLNPDEAIYPIVFTLPDGTKLDGSKHNYTLTFAANDMPPVDAFWSLSMYDATTGLFADNPINRYAVSSALLPSMKRNADGSLTLLIQKDAPDDEWKNNWLPAANGPLSMILRLYAPRQNAQDGTWVIPPVVQVR
jgi:hypothetical protein